MLPRIQPMRLTRIAKAFDDPDYSGSAGKLSIPGYSLEVSFVTLLCTRQDGDSYASEVHIPAPPDEELEPLGVFHRWRPYAHESDCIWNSNT